MFTQSHNKFREMKMCGLLAQYPTVVGRRAAGAIIMKFMPSFDWLADWLASWLGLELSAE